MLRCFTGLWSGGDGNPYGASKNSGAGAADRRALSTDGFTDKREVYGICLDVPTAEFKKELNNLVEESGKMVGALCNTPQFQKPGRTLERTFWEKDSKGQLVLGYHNSHSSTANPRCQSAGTLPGVLKHDSEGVRCWHVADWAVEDVRNGNVVFRGTHNAAARAAAKAANAH